MARVNNGDPYFPNEELQHKELSHHILSEPGGIQGMEHKVRCGAVSKPSQLWAEGSPTLSGLEGILSFFYDYS